MAPLSRRTFLLGAATALAAPAVVRAESLMKLWVPPAPKLVFYRSPSSFTIWFMDKQRTVLAEISREYAPLLVSWSAVQDHTNWSVS